MFDKARLALLLAGALALTACGSAPTLNGFIADKSSVGYGGTVQLSWSVADAESVTLTGPGEQTISGSGATITPTATGSWVLTATNGHGSTQSSPITITVTANLTVSAGVENPGTGTNLLLYAVDGTGQPPASDWTVHLTPDSAAGPAFDVSCTGGESNCYVEKPGLAPTGSNWTAQATIGGEDITTTFPPGDVFAAFDVPNVKTTYDGATTIDASWGPINGATNFVAQAFDLSTGAAISDLVASTTLSATLPLTSTLDVSHEYGVQVTARSYDASQAATLPLTPPNSSVGMGYLDNLPGTHWYFYTPSDYASGQLQVTIDNLAAGEQLAVIPINFGGPENLGTTLTVSGTNTLALRTGGAFARYFAQAQGLPDASRIDLPRLARIGEANFRAQERKTIADFFAAHPHWKAPAPTRSALRATTAPATSTTFCVQQGLGAGVPTVRKSATLAYETAHALFYVDDDDLSEYASFPWTDGTQTGLAELWENDIYPKDTQTFGAESDIDGNGKLIIFFTHELGAATSGGILLGYYSANSILRALDTSTGCSGSGSNAADMFFMNDLGNIEGANYTADEISGGIYPDTLGHEFQHLINFNQHALVHGGSGEDTWINEGLSVTAEDIVGFGWNTSHGREEGSQYLAYYVPTASFPYTRYFDASLTQWEGDPIGNYQGSHSFFRYFTDRFGPGILGDLDQSAEVGQANLERVLGEPFVRAYAEWTTSLMFSNETFSPGARFNFSQGSTAWYPLHSTLSSPSYCTVGYPGHDGHVGYLPLNGSASASLRQDGWSAFVTGTGNGAPVTLTLDAGGATPYLVVVRFSGALPDGAGTCP